MHDELRLRASQMRLAPSGESQGDFDNLNWSDKPHRVLFDACRHMEKAADLIEAQAAEIERLREADKAVASAGLLLSRAFNRIHCLPRTSDTELAQAIGEWRRDYIDRPWKAARAALSGDDHE